MIASAFPFLQLAEMALVTAIVVSVLAFVAPQLLTRFANGIWRLKWLLLAILFLYLRGDAQPHGSKLILGYSADAWSQVADRWLLLICLLASVYLFVATQNQQQLVDAIMRLTKPLKVLGVDTERLANRIGLTFESVADAERHLQSMRVKSSGGLVDAAAKSILGLEQKPLADSNAGELTVTISSEKVKLKDYLMVFLLGSGIVFLVINAGQWAS